MARLIRSQVEFEGRVREVLSVEEEVEATTWPPDAPLTVVGRPLARVDGRQRVSGQAEYTFDVSPPGVLHARFLRCPYPHARLRRLHTAAAEALEGVRAVLSHLNAPAIPWHVGSHLFDRELRFQGDEVAAVAADSPEAAEDALHLIEVEYEPLPFVVDLEAAAAEGAPAVHEGSNAQEPQVYLRGDLERGWQEAEVVVEATYRTQGALHNCLETHGCVAAWDGEFLNVWESTQGIFATREGVARILGLPLHHVRVVTQYLGGGFGSKQEAGKHTIVAALLARRAGRPVKLMLDRAEENLATGHRHATVQRLRLGARRDGTLTALDLRALIDLGAYGNWPGPVAGPARELYRCPHVRTEEVAVFTNTGSSCAFRAPGYTEGIFALEQAMDELAERLGLDPLELRLANYADNDQVSNREYTSKGLRAAYQAGRETIGWGQHPPPSSGPRRRGVGLASQIWGGGGGPPAYAYLKLNPDGTADLITGTQDIGTGTKTVLVQIAAQELGLPPEAVRILAGDTQAGPYAPVSGGSMTVPSMGPAVQAAAAEARRHLLEVAADLLDTSWEGLYIEAGQIVASDGRRVPIGQVLERVGSYMFTGKGSRRPNPPDRSIRTFGVQFAEVEVDTETGQVHVERVVAVHESGRIINPLTAGSQIEGGVIQGLGYALMEQRVIDRATGIVLSTDLETYKLPTALDVPTIEHALVAQPDPTANSTGTKGLGEPPIIPTAAAIANAVYAAIGVRLRELPITPDRMLQALAARAEGGQP